MSNLNISFTILIFFCFFTSVSKGCFWLLFGLVAPNPSEVYDRMIFSGTLICKSECYKSEKKKKCMIIRFRLITSAKWNVILKIGYFVKFYYLIPVNILYIRLVRKIIIQFLTFSNIKIIKLYYKKCVKNTLFIWYINHQWHILSPFTW